MLSHICIHPCVSYTVSIHIKWWCKMSIVYQSQLTLLKTFNANTNGALYTFSVCIVKHRNQSHLNTNKILCLPCLSVCDAVSVLMNVISQNVCSFCLSFRSPPSSSNIPSLTKRRNNKNKQKNTRKVLLSFSVYPSIVSQCVATILSETKYYRYTSLSVSM